MFAEFKSPGAYLASRCSNGLPDSKLTEAVRSIIGKVVAKGDAALRKFTRDFDGVDLREIRVAPETIAQSLAALDPETRSLFANAVENVEDFHKKQLPESWLEETPDGSKFGMQFKPIQRVGCYVPGGRAAYPSTVIMTVVPAQIAGVAQIVLTSPPSDHGEVNSMILAVAGLLGVDEIYAVGGVQAIAALALGTQSIPKVNKIVGPGNAYVNEAKRQLFGAVGIDSLAGPTEVVLLADDSAEAKYIVQDLFAQAEHDPDAVAILVTTSDDLALKVQRLATDLIKTAGRSDILKKSIGDHGAIVRVEDIEEGVALVNELAPEHLQIMTASPEDLLPKIQNAGAILLGAYSPVAIGDYFAGPNHVLPTAQTARFASPLGVYDFMKFSSVLEFSKDRLRRVQQDVGHFAELEGFPNHKDSVLCRND